SPLQLLLTLTETAPKNGRVKLPTSPWLAYATPLSVHHARSIDDEFPAGELPFPAARKMSFHIPVCLASVVAGRIDVGILSLHADTVNVPLHLILKNFRKIVLLRDALSFRLHQGDRRLLYFIRDLVPLPVPF